MSRKGVQYAILFLAAFSVTLPLGAEILTENDFRTGGAEAWLFSGEGTIVNGTGAVLVDNGKETTGTVTYVNEISASHYTISFDFSLQGGGEGLALALVDTASAEINGTGRGMFGVGNLLDCTGSIVVEFDLFSNGREDFGPVSGYTLHCGIADESEGTIEGEDFIETSIEQDLSACIDDPLTVELSADVHLQPGSVTVVVKQEREGGPRAVLQKELSGFSSFSPYLVFGAATGRLPGRAMVHYVKLETATLPAPSFEKVYEQEGDVHLSWNTHSIAYGEFDIYRNGTAIAQVNGIEDSFIDTDVPPGEHVYWLAGKSLQGAFAAPATASAICGRPVLVVDKAAVGVFPSQNAALWLNGFAARDKPVIRKTSIEGVELEECSAVVWIHGSGHVQGTVTEADELQLADYFTRFPGARIYMEGADLWSFHITDAFARTDGIQAIEPGWPASAVLDSDGELWEYWGGSCTLDEIEPAFDELTAEFTRLWFRTNDIFNPEEGEPVAVMARHPDDGFLLIASSVELYRLKEADISEAMLEEYISLLSTPFTGTAFLRGDSTGDSTVNIADAINTLSYLFTTEVTTLSCPDAADTNDDGGVDLSDVVKTLAYLFSDSVMPEPGGAACGYDPTDDDLPPCYNDACSR